MQKKYLYQLFFNTISVDRIFNHLKSLNQPFVLNFTSELIYQVEMDSNEILIMPEEDKTFTYRIFENQTQQYIHLDSFDYYDIRMSNYKGDEENLVRYRYSIYVNDISMYSTYIILYEKIKNDFEINRLEDCYQITFESSELYELPEDDENIKVHIVDMLTHNCMRIVNQSELSSLKAGLHH